MSRENIQTNEYWLPYHYIPRYEDGFFTQVYNFCWGFEYISLMDFVKNNLPQKYDSHLDFGCGDGRLLNYIYGNNECRHNLMGIDLDERAIIYAKLLNNNSIKYICDDICSLQEKFDIISCVEVIEHIPPRILPDVINCLHNKLVEGGRLILTVPSTNFPVSKKHYQHFSPDTLSKTLRVFRDVKINYLISHNFWYVFIMKLMSNRFFILNNKFLIKKLYNIYREKVVKATEGNAVHLTAICYK